MVSSKATIKLGSFKIFLHLLYILLFVTIFLYLLFWLSKEYTFRLNISISSGKISVKSDRVVVYLTQKSRIPQLATSLWCLFENFINRFNYTILIFHTGDVSLDDIVSNLSSSYRLSPSQLSLIELHTVDNFYTYPSSYTPERNPSETDAQVNYAHLYPHYQQMCAFWFRKVFLHPRLHNVQYFMRLDTDSYLLSPLTYDPFAFMARHQLAYGYRARLRELCCEQNIARFVRDYVHSRGLDANQLPSSVKWMLTGERPALERVARLLAPVNSRIAMYYNNFEVRPF